MEEVKATQEEMQKERTGGQREEPQEEAKEEALTEAPEGADALAAEEEAAEGMEETEEWLRDPEEEEGVFPSFLGWVGTVLLLLVPAANLVVLFEWASGHTKYPIRVNFARAMIPALLAFYAVLAVGILVL